MQRSTLRLIAAAGVISLFGAACAAEDTAEDTTTTTAADDTGAMDDMGHDDMDMDDVDTPTGAGVDAPAAELRAGLTGLLQEHVYLAGIAISTAVGDGLEAPSTGAAVETLDGNSIALADAISGIYGDDAGEQFLALWRDHITMFVDYTAATAGGDQDAADAAKAELDAYRTEFAAFIDSATDGELAAGTTAENLQVHVDTLVEAIDLVIAGDAGAFDALQTAAAHMNSTALALSGAIVAQMPDQFGA